MEVFIAPLRLWALSHWSSQDSPSRGTGSHFQPPHPARPRPANSSPLLPAPAPPPDTTSLGLPTSAPPLVKIPGRKACLHHLTGSGRSPGGGNGNLLQHSCLENPMDRGLSMGVCKEWDTTEVTEHARTHLRKRQLCPGPDHPLRV